LVQLARKSIVGVAAAIWDMYLKMGQNQLVCAIA
jgi:hypothetical protein